MIIQHIRLIDGRQINRAKFKSNFGNSIATDFDHDEDIEEIDGWFWQKNKKYNVRYVVEVSYETKELEA